MGRHSSAVSSGNRSRHRISRRDLLKSGIGLLTTSPLAACLHRLPLLNRPPGVNAQWPRYILRRELDELYFELTALGYEEKRFLGHRFLERVAGFPDPLLVFAMAPQH